MKLLLLTLLISSVVYAGSDPEKVTVGGVECIYFRSITATGGAGGIDCNWEKANANLNEKIEDLESTVKGLNSYIEASKAQVKEVLDIAKEAVDRHE